MKGKNETSLIDGEVCVNDGIFVLILQRHSYSGEWANVDKIELLALLLNLKIVSSNENYEDQCFFTFQINEKSKR